MNIRIDLAIAYHIGYEDALAKRMPDSTRAGVLNSYNCSNSEQTTTVDETDTWECVCNASDHYGESLTVHFMECSECGRTYEHVNGDYEYCPHCRARIVEVDDG